MADQRKPLREVMQKMVEEHQEKVNKMAEEIAEASDQFTQGLITPHELANKTIDAAYRIKSECETVGAWILSWGLGK